MKRPVLLAVLSLLLPCAGAAQGFGERCEHRAERSATVPAAGADLLRLTAAAGSLRIEGRPGAGEVRVRGVACASSAALLEGIDLEAGRAGDEARVEVRMPEERGGRGDRYARLDLVVEVPATLALDVEDGSGGVEVRGVASLRLRDGSGEVEVAGVAGDVQIEDGSGEIRLSDVRGSVRLDDSSGGIEVRGVQGDVLVERDGSGEIDISGVTRSVRVDRDSSGEIRVSDVRGDFVVDRDGSGGIRYDDVAGTVRVPARRR